MKETKHLLSIIEQGGYPDFVPVYQQLGYTVESVTTARKAISWLKRNKANVIVAEFNFQSDFRDRTSSLESILATAQRYPDARVIVFYDKEREQQLARLQAVFPDILPLAFPIDESALHEALKQVDEK
ncbi:MAG: hypothetical protein IME93_06390 [Proteobacteria bacterium]|nr:hypothetical protein [Pseudomonadota bacterium]